jgi:hypothetical protein
VVLAALAALLSALTPGAPRFEDVTDEVGIEGIRFAMDSLLTGAAWLDWDEDGAVDLLVSGDAQRSLTLYRSQGPPGYAFEDVTDIAGLSEYDRDAALDVMTLHGRPAILMSRQSGIQGADWILLRLPEAGGAFVREPINTPGGFAFMPTHGDLDGDGQHEAVVTLNTHCGRGPGGPRSVFRLDVVDGVLTPNLGGPWPLAGCASVPVVTDYAGDGRSHVVVTSDFGPEHVPTMAVADGGDVDASLPRVFGMGVAVGDVDGDLVSDYLFSTIGDDVLWAGPVGQRRDRASELGMANGWGPTGRRYKWGAAFFDADNDGALDLYTCAGFLPGAADTLQRSSLVVGGVDVAGEAGVATETTDRSVALADYDADGRVDMLVGSQESWTLFRNVTETDNHWLEVGLNNAPGTRVVVECDGVARQREWVGSTAAAQAQTMVHFGLGTCGGPARVRVRYPFGTELIREAVPVDQRIEVGSDATDAAIPPVRWGFEPWPPRVGQQTTVRVTGVSGPLEVEGGEVLAPLSESGLRTGVVRATGEQITLRVGEATTTVQTIAAVDPVASGIDLVRAGGQVLVAITLVDGLGVPAGLSADHVQLLVDGKAGPIVSFSSDRYTTTLDGPAAAAGTVVSVRAAGITLQQTVEVGAPGPMDSAQSVLFTDYETLPADGQALVGIRLYASDASGRAIQDTPGALELEGLIAVDCPGDDDPREPIIGWEPWVDGGLYPYWDRCARVDATPGPAVARLGDLEVRLTKVAPVSLAVDPTMTQVQPMPSGALIVIPRDADGRRVGSGVTFDIRSDPPGAQALYVDDGEYVITGDSQRLSIGVDGRFELAIGGGVPVSDSNGGCGVSDAAHGGAPSLPLWLLAILLLVPLRNGRRLANYL